MMDSGGEQKRARIERQFLFLDMYRVLVGIDLSKDDGSDSPGEPPYAAIRFLLDLENKRYPKGMGHVQIGEKHFLLGGVIEEDDDGFKYSDRVRELITDRSRIPTDDIIEDPELVLKLSSSCLKEGKFAMVFNLKGKHYLLHVGRRLLRCAPEVSLPFERLDVNQDGDIVSSIKVSDPPLCYFPHTFHRIFFNPSYASRHFILDDKLVLFGFNGIQIFTPPDDNDSGDGSWSVPPEADIDNVEKAFETLTDTIPEFGIFLPPEFNVPDVAIGDTHSSSSSSSRLRVLLTLHTSIYWDEIEEEKKKLREQNIPGEFGEEYRDIVNVSRFNSDQVFAYAISEKTFQPKYYQKIDGLFSDLLPDRTNPLLFTTKCHRLLDLGKGHQEGSRSICAILTGLGRVDDEVRIPYLFVSFFDVQLIESSPGLQSIEPPSAGLRDFLKVSPSPPIRKYAFKMRMDQYILHDAFLV